MFLIFKTDYFHLGFLTKVTCAFLLQEKQYLPHHWSDKGYKGTLNRCGSDITIFAWRRVTWNYAYNPFKQSMYVNYVRVCAVCVMHSTFIYLTMASFLTYILQLFKHILILFINITYKSLTRGKCNLRFVNWKQKFK